MKYCITATAFGNVDRHMLLTQKDNIFYSIEDKIVSFDTDVLQTAMENGWLVEVHKEDFKQLKQVSNCLYHANLARYMQDVENPKAALLYSEVDHVVKLLNDFYHEMCYEAISKGRRFNV